MEALNLLYIARYQVLICQDCGFALTASNYETHLRKLHRFKGEALHAALNEVQQLKLQAPNAVPLLEDGHPPIRGLKSIQSFHCALPACNSEHDALSQHRRKVEKHQSRIHRVAKQRKSQKPTPQDIEVVCVQSFFDIKTTYYRPFIVSQQDPTSGSNGIGLHAETQGSTQALDLLQSRYKASQQDWMQAFEELPDLEQSRSTTPPWLKETGIAEYLSRQSLGKGALRALVQRPSYSTSIYTRQDPKAPIWLRP